jgi:AhpD family alkylhydroperoxidase
MTVNADPASPVNRINLTAVEPEVFGAMLSFGSEAEKGLSPAVAQLVKIRSSQLNGCAYCLGMHTREAREAGESDERLDALSGWWHTSLFSDRERAALALAEAITLVAGSRVPDAIYADAARHFDEAELAHLLWTITAINTWNRVAIATGMTPA